MYQKNIRVGIGFASRLVCDRRLAFCPYGSAGVTFSSSGSTVLVSYETAVCEIDSEGWLTCSGTYSVTTRKHIGAFMKEYGRGASYYTAKECYEKGHAFNVITGEVMPLADYVNIRNGAGLYTLVV